MSSIKEIRALEQRLTDIVDNYIQKFYNEDDMLAISRRCGNFTLKADDHEAIKNGNTIETHSSKELVWTDDDGIPEPNCDKISEIANSWLFLD